MYKGFSQIKMDIHADRNVCGWTRTGSLYAIANLFFHPDESTHQSDCITENQMYNFAWKIGRFGSPAKAENAEHFSNANEF